MKIHGSGRAFALLATMAAVAAALAFLFGSGPSAPSGVQAAGTPTATVSCADVYQDISDDTPLGNAHDGDDIPAASSMNRIEPSQTSTGDFDLTTVTYLGPDLVPEDEADVGLIPGDAIPDVLPATVLCATATGNANSGAETGNAMHAQHDPANQYSDRPQTIARFGTYNAGNNEDGGAGGDCGDGADNGDSGLSFYSFTSPARDELDRDCYDFPGADPDTLVSSSCNFAESSTGWSRTETFSKIVNKTAKLTNYGKNVLSLNTAVPATTVDTNGDTVGDEATNPAQCTGGLAFPSVSESTIREPTTDEPGLAKNTANSIPTDAAGALDTADGLADDYDGDGCTDWDELDKNFSGTYPVSVTGPVHGMDPFNPADCDQNFNSTVGITVIARHNTAGMATVAGNGQYFRCIGDLTDPKGAGTRAVSLRMSCYSDSPVSTVNPNYVTAESLAACVAGNAVDDNGNGWFNDGCPAVGPAEAGGDCSNNTNDDGDTLINDGCPTNIATCGPGLGPTVAPLCGDGQSGGVPPGTTQPSAGTDRATRPYQDIDAVTYPILASGTYDKGTNTLTIGGCFPGYAAPPIGPNLYGSGSFDTRTGAGTFVVRFGIPITDPCDATHGINACLLMPGGVCTATLVELKSKKDILGGGGALPDIQHRNTDRDGCTDTQELRSTEGTGGKRDPFNDYDYFNPDKSVGSENIQRVSDILKVVGQYHIDDPAGNIDYTSETDRTAIPGANAWNLGPPDGIQRVDDILAAVKQYHHDCVT